MRIYNDELIAMADSLIKRLEVFKTRVAIRMECKEKRLEADEADITFLMSLMEEAEELNTKLMSIR